MNLSVMQLVILFLKARAALADSLRLEPLFNSKSAVRRKTALIREEVHSAENVEKVVQPEAKNVQKFKENFYTTAIVQPKKNASREFDVKKVLIDEDNSINLIPERMITKMTLNVIKNNLTVIKVANGE